MPEMGPDSRVQTVTVADLNELYDEGRYKEVLELGGLVAQEVHTRLGWCHYRAKDYGAALEQADLAGDTQGSLSLRASIHAYGKGYQDEKVLLGIIPKLAPENINAYNAIAISARSPNSTIPEEQVWESTQHLVNTLEPDTATVAGANLVHNLARLALAKGDLSKAETLIDQAIGLYGEETHIHHRAAACFWKSKIHEAQERPSDAREAASKSLDLWEEQLGKDPSNTDFQDRVRGARTRLADLS